MSYRLVITDDARQQLRDSARWWADHRSADEAARWFDGFDRKIDRLKENPHSHSLAAEDEDFPYELRELLFGLGSRPTHRALFTIQPETVIVLAIRHVAQDRVAPDDVTLPANDA
jgi:plasmid stabilization system protein ParE